MGNLALDRNVSVISKEDDSKTVTTLLDALNYDFLILLGEPGAGKTYSFEAASEYEEGDYLTVRDYVGINGVGTGENAVFLDALDEFRTSFTDKDLILELSKILSSPEFNPPKLRLSCRAADWYGDSDLRLLKVCFPDYSFAVVALASLRDDEIVQILESKGISKASEFVEKAISKGVDNFLHTPQTLIMLAGVVQDGVWPNTKLELYSEASRLLLTEHNKEHDLTKYAGFTDEELLSAAGAICASILISGVAGVSLLNHSANKDYPSYKSLNYQFPEHIKAALIKRAFITIDTNKHYVTYFHRTIAEFMAANWLTQQVKDGYPLGRVLSLLCHDGATFSELRGLYAWFSALNHPHTETLIKGDPYGVLMYGDVTSFIPAMKKRLLQELVNLSHRDPWFRSSDWSSEPLGALSSPDLVNDFREILNDTESSFHIKSLVLDAIANGPELDEMRDCLRDIVCDSERGLGKKNQAVIALIKAVSDGSSIVLFVCLKVLANQLDALSLRIDIISALHRFGDQQVQADEVSTLLIEILQSEKDLSIGETFYLHDVLKDEQLPEILDSLVCHSKKQRVSWRPPHYMT